MVSVCNFVCLLLTIKAVSVYGFIFWIEFISWIWGWIQSQWIRLVLTGTTQGVNVETAQEVDKDSIICIILLKNVNLSEVDQTSFHHNNFSWSLLKYPTGFYWTKPQRINFSTNNLKLQNIVNSKYQKYFSGLLLGSSISRKFAAFLEENDLFVPDDDDVDWSWSDCQNYKESFGQFYSLQNYIHYVSWYLRQNSWWKILIFCSEKKSTYIF